MAFSVQMPALGESVTEGTVTRWLKQEGDTVELDEPLVEVSTDKVDTEIPSPAAGVLTKIVAQEDDTVEVGGELAIIGDGTGGDSSGGGAPRPARAGSPARTARLAQPKPEPEPSAARPSPSPNPSPSPQRRPSRRSGGGSATPVLMPELGESVTEGTVTRWLKKVGDSVQVDEPLVEVSTDKVDTEIPSPVAGVLVSITAEEDDTVQVGGELARIGTSSRGRAPPRSRAHPSNQNPSPSRSPNPNQSPHPRRPNRHPPRSRNPSRRRPEPKAEPAAAEGDGAPYVTPLVRKLAAENNIDLTEVTGTGVGGRIRKQDVLAAAEAKAASQAGACGRSRSPGHAPLRRPRKRRLRRLRWPTCAGPRRRPAGSARSPPRRPANLCRPPRSSPRPTRST